VSSAELSLDISQIVSRALGGEPIDVAGQSEALAARHADLGMPAELIAKAIARAAGMVGVALDGAGEDIIVPAASASGPAEAVAELAPDTANGTHAGDVAAEPGPLPDQAADLRRVFLGE
jgi:hypothetical protein